LESKVKSLIQGYIQKAEKKLSVAEKLYASGDYEDAVSRAYYAVFHAAQALLLTEGEQAASHKGVVTLFGLLFVKNALKVLKEADEKGLIILSPIYEYLKSKGYVWKGHWSLMEELHL